LFCWHLPEKRRAAYNLCFFPRNNASTFAFSSHTDEDFSGTRGLFRHKESAAARLNSGLLLRHFALSHISRSIMAHSFLGSAFLEENCTKRIFTFTVAAFGRHHPLIYLPQPFKCALGTQQTSSNVIHITVKVFYLIFLHDLSCATQIRRFQQNRTKKKISSPNNNCFSKADEPKAADNSRHT
jgi:hypothetical protein